MFASTSAHSTMERTTQTEPPKVKKWKQIWLCFLGDDKFRRQREREAAEKGTLPFKIVFFFSLAFEKLTILLIFSCSWQPEAVHKQCFIN